jgi:hypothetical protein
MLTSSPMDCEHNNARIIVDINDDVGDQRPQQFLASTHRNARCIPRRRQIVRQVCEGARIDLDIRRPFSGLACLKIPDTPERGLPVLLQLAAMRRLAGLGS